jgi:hypothetical protein
VHAYIIDTGIRFTHTTFGGRAVSGRDTVDNDNDATDCNGHGTHVAGTVGGSQYGVAKGVALVGVRVLDCNGSGTTAGVVAGVDWVTANAIKPAVANMSLGGGLDTTLDNAVAGSIASGVTYGIAAGNSNANACNFSPARVPAAITVGATDINDNRASFSNFGTCVDIFAPGVNITSSWLTSDTATNTISGTSMATPHVVGVAALIASANPSFTPQQVRDRMVADATTGVVVNPGTGSPNRLLFVNNGTAPPPPPTRFEAENATLSQAVVATNHTGFSGTGFVDYNNVVGSFVEWQVPVQSAGQAQLTFRYANGSTANRPMNIAVNGALAAGEFVFAPTGSWNTWANVTATVTLNAGTNTIRATAVTASGGPNVDFLDVNAVTPATRHEAENAHCDGTVDSDHAGFSGTGYCNTLNQVGSAVEWTVTGSTGPVSLTIRFANGSTGNRPMNLTVNGTTVAQLAFAPTGAWTTWATTTATAAFNAGSNTIRISATTAGGGPNVDYLEVRLATG